MRTNPRVYVILLEAGALLLGSCAVQHRRYRQGFCIPFFSSHNNNKASTGSQQEKIGQGIIRKSDSATRAHNEIACSANGARTTAPAPKKLPGALQLQHPQIHKTTVLPFPVQTIKPVEAGEKVRRRWSYPALFSCVSGVFADGLAVPVASLLATKTLLVLLPLGFCAVFILLALFFGCIALYDMKNYPYLYKGKWLAIIGLVLSLAVLFHTFGALY